MRDLIVYVLPAAAGMSAVYAVSGWWMEAHTRWLARLSARGLIESRVTPFDAPRTFVGGLTGNAGWARRQRMSTHDAAVVHELRRRPDQDRPTETWRIRSLRRRRLLVLLGVAWLGWCTVFPLAFAAGEWRGVIATAAVLAVAALLAGPRLYRRASAWGEYELQNDA